MNSFYSLVVTFAVTAFFLFPVVDAEAQQENHPVVLVENYCSKDAPGALSLVGIIGNDFPINYQWRKSKEIGEVIKKGVIKKGINKFEALKPIMKVENLSEGAYFLEITDSEGKTNVFQYNIISNLTK